MARRFRGPFRRKRCRFCVDKVAAVDYKDVQRLRKCVTDPGKIIPVHTLDAKKFEEFFPGRVILLEGNGEKVEL